MRDRADADAALALCVDCHNDGTIDLLSIVNTKEFGQLTGPSFFMVQQFLKQAIPKLQSPVKPMVQVVDLLVSRAGNDGAATQPYGAFREWCAADLERAHETIQLARSEDAAAIRLLPFALQAAAAIDVAREILMAYSDDRQRSAIVALGRIPHSTPEELQVTISLLADLIDNNSNDHFRAIALDALLGALSLSAEPVTASSVAALQKVIVEAAEHTIHVSARALWKHKVALDGAITEHLLQAVALVDPKNKGTIAELDMGLQALLEAGMEATVLQFLRSLLTKHGNALALSNFSYVSSWILSGPSERLSNVVVSWLLSAEPVLCNGVSKLLRKRSDRDLPLSLAPADLTTSPDTHRFLCRKAIGYFFLQPVVAASVLICVLRITSDEVAAEVRSLLADVLLQNYGGELRTYLDSIDQSDPAKTHVLAAIEQNEAYLRAMRDIPEIKELHPSERERQIEHARGSEEMKQALKKAESGSIFLSIVKRSVILYGNRSISFTKGPDGARHAHEMDLKAHGVSMEFPRIEVVDPLGLDIMLLVFRTERPA